MACPAACNNGGGQPRPQQVPEAKARLAEVERLYGAAPPPPQPAAARRTLAPAALLARRRGGEQAAPFAPP